MEMEQAIKSDCVKSRNYLMEVIMEETISIAELLQTVKKRLWLIILCVFVAVSISAVLSFYVFTPVYQASSQILVNQAKNGHELYNFNEVQTNVQLIGTYSVIIKSPTILESVKKQLHLPDSVNTLNNKISVESDKESQVFSVVVEDTDPRKAADIANATAISFKQKIPHIMNVDNVSILSKADMPPHPSPIKPKPTLNLTVGLIVGLIVGIGLAVLLEYLDNTVKREQDIEKLLGIPVIGSVTMIRQVQESAASTPKVHHQYSAGGKSVGS
jgi:capsular polysaccharide biosynthesis protein